MEKLKSHQRALFFVNVLKVILSTFTTTFLTSHIVNLTPDNVLGQGVFNIGVMYCSQFIAYIVIYFILSYLVTKSNRTTFFRMGIVIYAVLLVAIVLFGEDIAEWIILTGALLGIGEAFYASSYIVIKNELISRTSILKFNLSVLKTSNTLNSFVPIILGFLIDITTYPRIAFFAILIAVIQFLVSFGIKPEEPIDSSFELRNYFKYLKHNKYYSRKIGVTYFDALLAGVKNTYKILCVILTIYIFQSNISLGIFTSVFSFITNFFLKKYKKSESKERKSKILAYLALGFLPFFATVAFVVHPDTITLIILNGFLTLAVQFSEYFGGCERDAVIKNINQHAYIAEHQFIYEFMMSLSIIGSYALFVFVGLKPSTEPFKILMLAFVAINPIRFLLLYKQRQVRIKLEAKNNQDYLSATKNVESLYVIPTDPNE